MDITRDTWVLGDSWTVLYDNRWPYWAIEWGFSKWLLSGIAGEGSAEGLGALKNLLALATPKRVVWCYGMNDIDSNDTTPNADWLAAFQELETICENNSIELIVSLVPTATSRNNNAKNAYILASGHRYVNTVAAVGADTSGNWFSGYAQDDGVHPTTIGAKALAARFLADVPELTIQ
jgi:lysophospholipase L1-like esterase